MSLVEHVSFVSASKIKKSPKISQHALCARAPAWLYFFFFLRPRAPRVQPSVGLIMTRWNSVAALKKSPHLQSQGRWEGALTLRWKSIPAGCLALWEVGVDECLLLNYVFCPDAAAEKRPEFILTNERALLCCYCCYCWHLNKSSIIGVRNRAYRMCQAAQDGKDKVLKRGHGGENWDKEKGREVGILWKNLKCQKSNETRHRSSQQS